MIRWEPSAELVTEPIDRIDPKGVVMQDGRLREIGVLVPVTGVRRKARDDTI
jgi:hypothetical protein